MSKNRKSAYLVYGDDEFKVASKAKSIVDGLVSPEQRALSLEVVEGKCDTVDKAVAALQACMMGLKTVGFFGAERVIWLRGADFFGDNVVARSETVKERVQALTGMVKGGLSSGQVLVVSADKVDGRTAFRKAFDELGEVFEFSVGTKSGEVDRASGESLAHFLKETGLEMDGDARSEFLRRVGGDTRQIANEVEKLRLYLGGCGGVGLADVLAITGVSKSDKVWDLQDAVGRRDLNSAISCLRQLLFQKEAPIMIVSCLESRMKDLAILRDALDKGWLVRSGGRNVKWVEVPSEVDDFFARVLERDPRKTHPFRTGVLAEQAAGYTRGLLQSNLALLLEAHAQLLSGSARLDDVVLEVLVLRLIGRPKRGRA